MKGKEEDEERNENICLQTDRQSSREQSENSNTEATLILCGSSGERANFTISIPFHLKEVSFCLDL